MSQAVPERPSPLSPLDEAELLKLCGLSAPAHWELMRGDGSQRRFYRLHAGGQSCVAIVAGEPGGEAEAESYLYLAGHLRAAGAPVPEVYGALSGARVIVVEDLGSTHLEDVARRLSEGEREALYRRVLGLLSRMQVAAAQGLDEARLFQGAHFDRQVMLEKESRYFLERFVNGYRRLGLSWDDLAEDFLRLAEAASEPAAGFFLHRDFQSRNIMVRGGEIMFIDFQAGRFGPRAYDVASLLIDPYVGLARDLQTRLLAHYAAVSGEEPASFRRGYLALALQRNLQILGAFSFLGLVRGKRAFLSHIPAALESLRHLLADSDAPALPSLRRLAAGFW